MPTPSVLCHNVDLQTACCKHMMCLGGSRTKQLPMGVRRSARALPYCMLSTSSTPVLLDAAGWADGGDAAAGREPAHPGV